MVAPSLMTHLLSSSVFNPETLARERRIAAKTGDVVDIVLTRLGLVSEQDMT